MISTLLCGHRRWKPKRLTSVPVYKEWSANTKTSTRSEFEFGIFLAHRDGDLRGLLNCGKQVAPYVEPFEEQLEGIVTGVPEERKMRLLGEFWRQSPLSASFVHLT